MITLEDLDKIAEEIIWYDSLMTKCEYLLYQREYENFLQKVFQ